MNTEKQAPIPIPLRQRWRHARMRLVPALVFFSTVFAVAYLWKDYVAAPTLVGQAEPVLSNVTSYKAGVLAELSVNRFQEVKMGDPIGQVLVTDPRVLASSLAVIQAEIEVLRTGMKPVVAQQRLAVSYDQLRLNSMRDRAQLATSKVNLQMAETDFCRNEELLKDKIISQRVYDQAKANRDRLQKEVEELTKVVDQGDSSMKNIPLDDGPDPSKTSSESLKAAIALQESKLRLTEAELSPIRLTAPIDGIVQMVHHRSGEAITAGQPVVSISTLNPVRIVGYLRPPFISEPKVGMSVQVRTRGMRREVGMAEVKQVGTQLDLVPAALAGPTRLAANDLGLPIDVSMPSNLKIRPGELVDIIFSAKAN